MPVDQLRSNDMMAHLLDALEHGKDIGHYGRLVFAMYFATVVCPTSMPSLSSSPWIRGCVYRKPHPY